MSIKKRLVGITTTMTATVLVAAVVLLSTPSTTLAWHEGPYYENGVTMDSKDPFCKNREGIRAIREELKNGGFVAANQVYLLLIQGGECFPIGEKITVGERFGEVVTATWRGITANWQALEARRVADGTPLYGIGILPPQE